MGYRNLSKEQFNVIKDAAAKVCTASGLKTIRDFKRVGNELIDEIEAGGLSFGDLLQAKINYIPIDEWTCLGPDGEGCQENRPCNGCNLNTIIENKDGIQKVGIGGRNPY